MPNYDPKETFDKTFGSLEREGSLKDLPTTQSNPSIAVQKNSRDLFAMQWHEPTPITELVPDVREETRWVWEGFLARGCLTLLSAFWKAGKTTFLSWLLHAIQNELDLAGQRATPCNVLIVTEEGKDIWVDRRDNLPLVSGIWTIHRPNKRKMALQEWLMFLQKIAEFCQEKQIEVLIFDTLTTFWPVRDEGNPTEVTESLLPLNIILEKQISILLVHHLRKADGDEATASRGSGALTSSVDIIMEFRRFDAKNNQDTRRVIKSYSRFNDTPLEVVIRLTPDGYITEEGTKPGLKQRDGLQPLLELIPFSPTGISVSDLVEKWPAENGATPDRTTFYRWIKKLEEMGNVKNIRQEKDSADIWARFTRPTNKDQSANKSLELGIEAFGEGTKWRE